MSFPAAALLVVLLLAPQQASAALYNPHDFMEKEGSCGRCHLSSPVRADGGFVRDIVSLCRDCHFNRDRDSHPVDIRPDHVEDIQLPLDFEGAITCTTCHDPHSAAYSARPHVRQGPLTRIRGMIKGDGFRTFFLRQPNDRGQICKQCHSVGEISEGPPKIHRLKVLDYRGSGACSRCHKREYDAWRLTIHARTLGDPGSERHAIRAVFTGDESFSRDEVVRTVGNHWTQRYLLERSDELRVARDVWSIIDAGWDQRYWREQSWRELCAGCHYTGYNPYTNTFAEEGVTCESCHGPGGRHVDSRQPGDIVNPGRLDPERRDSICASCHTHGHDRTGEFRFPVGYLPGDDLARFYRGLIPKRGQEEDTFKGDGSLEDRLRSFRFWMTRFFAPVGVNCTLCKSYRSFGEGNGGKGEGKEPERMTLAEYCFSCHRQMDADGGHPGSAVTEDSDCYRCHGPLKDRQGGISVHDHKFVFDIGKRVSSP